MTRVRPDVATPVLLAAVLATWQAPHVWLTVLLDGGLAALLLLACAGWGAPLLRRLLPAWNDESLRTLTVFALGSGALATLTLALGLLGWLNRVVAIALVGAGVVLALREWHTRRAERSPAPVQTDLRSALLTAPLCVPLAILLLGAALPTGILWHDEARGYDVLEYHLQAPREYHEAGRILFLPHNVYANFPQQVEIFYLLLMHLKGSPHTAALAAQFFHAGFAILAALALACCAPPGPARRAALLLTASAPWLAYLGVLAYVECGLLFYSALACAVLLHTARESPPTAWRAVALAGLASGLAAGTKYTAIILTAAAITPAILLLPLGTLHRRLAHAALFSAFAGIAFAPWALRGALLTGNPVYPFAHEWLAGAAWSDEQAAQWARGHAVPHESATLSGRLSLAARELLGQTSAGGWRPALFGAATLAIGAAGCILAWRRSEARFALLLTGITLAAWSTLTYMPGRFAITLLIPAAVGLGASLCTLRGAARATLLGATLVAAILNAAQLALLWRRHDLDWQRLAKQPLAAFVGFHELFQDVHPLNSALPRGAHAWLVGDAAVFHILPRVHYTVVFNRDPWLEFAASASPATALEWLAQRGITHVVFHWPEIERLRRTYGFSNRATREWVAELQRAGLRRSAEHPEPMPGVEVWDVPGAAGARD